ncbi:uracil-DNA glycosylase [candidate division KSB1 bacterium]|nr:uracil-DNA glycosylase [candidate division KSB1 bacterium]
MKIKAQIGCQVFPCSDIIKESYVLPKADIDPQTIRMIMISEAPPQNSEEYFYAYGKPFYLKTTLQAFNDAGIAVASMSDILKSGVYITTAIKCGKTDYSVSSATIENCSTILEQELALFPNVKVIILNGDIAIKALNYISKKQLNERVIPGGSTYKIRKSEFYYKDIRVFPSYILTGKNFLIEKSKRQMIAEDIKTAWEILNKK